MTSDKDFNEVFAPYMKLFEKAARNSAAGIIEFYLQVPPTPASRPRVSRFGTYYGKNYQNFLNAAQPIAGRFDGVPSDKPLCVFVENVVAKPKHSKRDFPRGDVDNYAKGPLDVMTKAEKFWEDDDQVVLLLTSKRFAAPDEEPHVRIYYYEA